MGTDRPRLYALAVAAAVIAATGGVVVARRVAVTPAAAPAPLAAPVAQAPAAPSPSVSSSPPATRPPVRRPSARPARALPYALPAPPAPPTGCPPPPRKPAKPVAPWRPSVVVPESALPAALPPLTRSPSLAALRGKGMWTYQWAETEGGSAARVVARAKAAGLTQLWVRTGSSRSGFYAAPELRALLPRAHAAGIRVVAWDFPYLYDPVADAARAAETLAFTAPGGHRIDAFSPDVESPSEGTQQTPRRLSVYLGLVQRAADTRPVVSTVPHANDHWWRTYDYKTQVPYVDAFAVMAYWGCVEPGREVAQSVARLAPLGRPLHLIGQAFDLGPYGGRAGDPRGREVWRFADVAKRSGVIGASLYVWQYATREQFAALGAYPWR
ncbi:MAG TPA: hypothetical protein VFQ85_02130 [Mycobacteriales bacterium]|nr:hypothetical protein [Mycobacteriales bacterium]